MRSSLDKTRLLCRQQDQIRQRDSPQPQFGQHGLEFAERL